MLILSVFIFDLQDGVIEFAQERVGQQNGHGHWRFGLQSIKNIIAAGALGALTVGLFLKTKS